MQYFLQSDSEQLHMKEPEQNEPTILQDTNEGMQTDVPASTSSPMVEQILGLLNQIMDNQKKMTTQHEALEKNQVAIDDKITTILTL